MPLQQQLPQSVQQGERQLLRPIAIGVALFRRLRRIFRGADLDQGHAMHRLQQGAQHALRIDAEIILPAQSRQRTRRVAAEQQGKQIADGAAIRQAQHLAHGCRLHAAALKIGMGDRLVEDRQAIACRSLGRPGDQRQSLGLGGHTFRLAHRCEVRRQTLGRDSPQVEPLATRQHRHRHLVHLGRGEQKLHVPRRLLQRLQQPVERRLRQHVHFVDDVHFVPRRYRGVARRLDDLANVVDAGMAGGIHLDHVDMPPFGDGAAWLAHAARIDRRPAVAVRSDAVQRLCDQPRGGRLANPAYAGEQKRMRDPIAPDRILQRADHRFLADQRLKRLWAIFARQHPIGVAAARWLNRFV